MERKKTTMSPARPQPEWQQEYRPAPKVQYGKTVAEKTTKNGPVRHPKGKT